MRIVEVAVEIGETRNHPFEYGNYRASVRLTAEVSRDESALGIAYALRDEARMHVLEECDEWEDRIKEEHRIAQLENDIDSCLRGIDRSSTEEWIEEYRDRAQKSIAELRDGLQAEWEAKVDEAYRDQISWIEQREREMEQEQKAAEDIEF